MNILIVGNGFDLSHYLPTKYDHFMVAMQAIENWDESKGDMGFDDLFGKDYWFKDDKTGEEWQNKFFQYTKAVYKTGEIKISAEKIEELKKKLTENVWYQYFLDHVQEVKTWIDFERKIQQAIEVVFNFFNLVKAISNRSNNINRKVESYSYKGEASTLVLGGYESSLLNLLKILDCEFLVHEQDDVGKLRYIKVDKKEKWDFCNFYINEQYFFQTRNFEEFKFDKVVNHLQKNLDNFITIFNSYLEIIEELEPKKNFNVINEIQLYTEVFSFNYTSTCKKNYNVNQIEFLHGKIGNSQNIVLGISDLERKYLEKYKFYGFTKYHQKLMKQTNYKFLLENDGIKSNLNFWLEMENEPIDRFYETETAKKYRTNIYIWGHSLDISDDTYIKEIFSLNDQLDCNVRVVIFYFDSEAKFDLLANLLHILEKEKVEKWMKKGWLKFEENPNIAEINGIKPVELPKLAGT
ncbi:AbiH family protein [Acinetobacter sp. NS-4]|uniref:AbiH family protein n=1 Tax=Acinetobacter sp. NS-4 TaxID=3127956 RepID=UPI00307F2173